jgi:amino acid transporter
MFNKSYGMKQSGFIQLIIIIVLLVIILSLLGVSLSSLVNDKTIRENFTFLWDTLTWLWKNYIAGFVVDIWETIKGASQSSEQ